MRELKFRIWDIHSHLKCYSNQYSLYCANGVISNGVHVDGEKKRYIAQQFTGLYDKNGKEIYEGDIVKYIVEGRNYEIKYGKAKFYPVLLDTIATHGYEYDWEYWYDECSAKEVVGNIFQNPELLK